MSDPRREQARAATRPQPPTTSRRDAIEVGSVDANMVFDDASAVLRTGEPSVVLDAIDAGTVAAVMSDQAFRELGWTSPRAARGHKVDHDDLRTLIGTDYLPRIRVVAMPVPESAEGVHDPYAGTDHWVPDVPEINDPDDVPHAQLAHLISATIVFSHDNDLRKPGYAPRRRLDYDQRIDHLSIVTDHRTVEEGTGILLVAAGSGAHGAVTKVADRFGIKARVPWAAIGIGAAAAVYFTLTSPSRRTRIGDAVRPLLTKFGEATARATAARRALTDAPHVSAAEANQLEVRVASYLTRRPAANMGEIADDLELTASERKELSDLLRAHPAFEQSGRYSWTVGRFRDALETSPRRRPASPRRSPDNHLRKGE